MKLKFSSRISWATRAALCCVGWLGTHSCMAAELRVGIIGTDSSHAVEFTRMLNDVAAKDHVGGARVVAAYRGGSPHLAISRDRIAAFSATLAERWKIPFVPRIADLCPKIDGLLLLSADPETRTAEFREAAACGKPIFVDKPFAPTLKAAREMADYAERHHVAWFSASALRFGEVESLRQGARGAEVWGPGALGEGYALDLSWYGIHSIELLYAVMGPGVRSVTRLHTADTDIITAVWADGRVGSIHLVRPDMAFGIVVFQSGGKAKVLSPIAVDYAPLLRKIVAFYGSKAAPVSANETLEVFALMEAAQRSMKSGALEVLPMLD